MKSTRIRIVRVVALLIVCLGLASCEDPQVYGSVGFSTFSGGGYHGGPRVGTSISVGGRIR